MMSQRSVRVLFVVPVGEKGGAEVVLLDIARGLDRSRFAPRAVCLKPGPFVEELQMSGVPAQAFAAHQTRQLGRVARAIRDIARVIRREGIDLVHCNGNSMLLYGGLAARLAGVPCVWQVYDPLSGGGAFERAFVTAQRRLRPAWTIFGTPPVAESFLATYKNLARHSTVLPGANIEALNQGCDPHRARAALSVPNEVPIISLFARLQRTKGQLILTEAASAVLQKFPDARFVLCGGALFGREPEYPAELRQQIVQRGLESRVLLRGYVSDDEKKDILAASTMVVHPALVEPFGISVIEGMAMGKPIVATDCAGPSLTVLPGETGLLVPRGDASALAQALQELLADPRKARLMGERGQHRVRRHFTVEAMVLQVEAIYEQVLTR